MRRFEDLDVYTPTEFLALIADLEPEERHYARADRLRALSEVALGDLSRPKGHYEYAEWTPDPSRRRWSNEAPGVRSSRGG